jgi:bla regulator protein BlaR1
MTSTMLLAVMLVALWIAGLLALGAWAADRLLRAVRVPTRGVWIVTMGASVALVGLAPIRAEWGASGSARPMLLEAIGVPSLGGPVADAASATARWLPEGAAAAAVALWALSVLAALVLLVGGRLRHRRLLRSAAPVHMAGSEVRLTDDFGPAVIGVLRPTVVVPRWLCARTAAEQALVVTHEREHIAARDPLLLLLGTACVTVMPWNPLLWWSYLRLRLAIEVDCDARVLRAGAPVREYGSLLLDLTAMLPRTRAGIAAFAARPSQLEERIVAMSSRPVTPRRRRTSIAAASLLAFAAVVVACSAEVADTPPTATPTAAQVAAPPAEAATGTPYFDFQVEKPVSAVPGSGFPRYPASLRSAGVEGEVLAQFVVGTDGRVELDSFRAIRASDVLFESAVHESLPSLRFTPAEIGGKPVRQLVQQPFVFQLAK